MMNIVKELHDKIKKSHNTLKAYQEIPTGEFAATAIQYLIDQAEKALETGDPVAMLKALKDLDNIE